MTPSMSGALIGFAIGFIGFVMLRIVANRVEKIGATGQPKQTAAMLRMAALADWLIFTGIGFFLGPMFITAQG